MKVSIIPKNDKLKEHIDKHGEHGWVIFRNDPMCIQRGGIPAVLVCKNNQMLWLVESEYKT